MATVYLGVAAREGGFQRHVAVKMIHGTAETDSHLANDLLKEAKIAAKIRHPNVVPVLDVGEDPYGLFLVMEYVEGDTLAGLRRMVKRAGEHIPEPVGLRIVTDALAGLHAAHDLKGRDGESMGVVHRDFSPHNILVGTDGVARLTDFGIAKVAYTAGHTRTGKIKGKIAYMSPEQARGAKVDQRCDVWAAGVVAWEALVGERLFDTEDEIGALLKIVNEDPPRLGSVRADLPVELDEALHWALTRDLDARCPSADALRRALLAAHPIADTAEVAEFVRRIVGPKLAERERKVEEIRRLRGQVGTLVDSMRLPPAGSNPYATTADRSGAHPAVGPLPPPPEFGEPRRKEDTTGASVAWHEREGSGGAPALDVSTVTSSLEKRLAALLGNRRNRAAIFGIAGGLSGGLLLLVILVAAIRGVRSGPATGSSGPVAVVSASAPTAPVPPPLPEPVPTPAASPVKPEPFVVRANAELVLLKLGKETQQVSPATKEVELMLQVAPDDELEAVSLDGRRTRGKITKGARELSLEFPKRAAPVASPRPTPKATATGGGFADNPYKKK
jgi:serine/threonine-protein kinase